MKSNLSPALTTPILALFLTLLFSSPGWGEGLANFRELIYDPGQLAPVDSELKVAIGDVAPDFTLPSIQGEEVRLSQFRTRKNVVLSFVPAAWTPVCSDQWPGYIFARKLFEDNDAVIVGITVDNVPTLHAWTRQMGELWFPVLSDFWPHGRVAEVYGVLRSNGTTERALFVIDKQGVIRNILVADINVRPPLDFIIDSLHKINGAD